MDGQRFDRWTRTLARGVPRRRVLSIVVGAGVAGLMARIAPHSGLADTCSDCGMGCVGRDGDCSGQEDNCCGSDICQFGTCYPCLPQGNKNCTPGNGDCCPGLSCRDPGPGYECLPDKNPDNDDDKKRKKKHRHKKKNHP